MPLQLRLLLLTVAMFSALACKKKSDSDGDNAKVTPSPMSAGQGGRVGCFNIVNGAATTDYPAVVLLVMKRSATTSASCSGTFVGPNTIMTAAHCIPSGMENDLRVFVTNQLSLGRTTQDFAALFQSGIAPKKIILRAKDISQSAASGNGGISTADHFRDLAIIIMNQKQAPATLALAKAPPKAGTDVTLVGFGAQNFAPGPTTDGLKFKQFGRNRIPTYTAEQLAVLAQVAPNAIRIAGDADDRGNVAGGRSLASHGDSGEPLLADGQVIGVASGGATAAQATADPRYRQLFPDPAEVFYGATYSDEAKAIVQEARAAGAEFSETSTLPVPGTNPGSVGCLQ